MKQEFFIFAYGKTACFWDDFIKDRNIEKQEKIRSILNEITLAVTAYYWPEDTENFYQALKRELDRIEEKTTARIISVQKRYYFLLEQQPEKEREYIEIIGNLKETIANDFLNAIDNEFCFWRKILKIKLNDMRKNKK